MVFSSLIFLFVFLVLNLTIYLLVNDRHKNKVLLVFSLIFYAWGGPKYLLLLVGETFASWFFALQIQDSQDDRSRKLYMAGECIVLLGLLGYFKYAVFFLENFQALFGIPEVIPNIVLPIGISFYTFQLLSYVVDVYRGEIHAQPAFWKLLLYSSLFHQCIAGPIVRYETVANEIDNRKVTQTDIYVGMRRFCIGLAKKSILANSCAAVADSLILPGSNALAAQSTLGLWLGISAYMLQIYLDFSAYSDMAIGMGLMVGFRYKENFNYPYLANSITDFWRRWHMSLSSFFRDYVYIPLGGNRKGKARQAFNLLVVWFLTGMWHGAGWNFILWGLYYFVFLALEKFLLPGLQRLPGFFAHLYTLVVVFFGWILFYFTDFTQGWVVLKGLFCLNGNPLINFESQNIFLNYLFFLVVAVVACTPLPRMLYHRLTSSTNGAAIVLGTVAEYILPVAGLLFSISYLVGDSYNPFLYLQF